MAKTARTARKVRQTAETAITVSVNLDGTGVTDITTGMPFLDHMLTLIGRHGLMNLKIVAKGDLEVDFHHTVEDIGLVFGQVLNEALGDRRGITRYGSAFIPMDAVLGRVVVDLGVRPYLVMEMACRRKKILDFHIVNVPAPRFLAAIGPQAKSDQDG